MRRHQSKAREAKKNLESHTRSLATMLRIQDNAGRVSGKRATSGECDRTTDDVTTRLRPR
jgi:hypothetical protein